MYLGYNHAKIQKITTKITLYANKPHQPLNFVQFHPISCTKCDTSGNFVQFRSIFCTKHHFIADFVQSHLIPCTKCDTSGNFVQFRPIFCTKYTALGHQVQLHSVTGYICHKGHPYVSLKIYVKIFPDCRRITLSCQEVFLCASSGCIRRPMLRHLLHRVRL